MSEPNDTHTTAWRFVRRRQARGSPHRRAVARYEGGGGRLRRLRVLDGVQFTHHFTYSFKALGIDIKKIPGRLARQADRSGWLAGL